ncbi:hypothetical protein C6N75_21555 [Streptomyces solincola]|uniref:GmrSD restriction endonucleases C-terminal domain-containing protein n=1 Tax=Streptomyces solincola TaxID=2100817 RepID=A0A2S9PS49_9ACTN|nr:HNH endonuclease family protein [Streptomyces solincola]PRH77203.1 hypothetical protein C6N75_21555 [Streptomyces solincola]
MIKNLTRGLAALALALTPLTAAGPAQAAPAVEPMLLADAVAALPVAEESRAGYTRTSFKHWNAGLDPADGCNTRAEVLLAEADVAPDVAPGCRLSGGAWSSYYDDQEVTDPARLDIDHMVPLAESWDSGAAAWTAARREAYANDQGAEPSLVAVTARSNRAKADRDPTQWMPPAPGAHCRYLTEWVATKLRWGLTVDPAERDALVGRAENCPAALVHFTPSP